MKKRAFTYLPILRLNVQLDETIGVNCRYCCVVPGCYQASAVWSIIGQTPRPDEVFVVWLWQWWVMCKSQNNCKYHPKKITRKSKKWSTPEKLSCLSIAQVLRAQSYWSHWRCWNESGAAGLGENSPKKKLSTTTMRRKLSIFHTLILLSLFAQ